VRDECSDSRCDLRSVVPPSCVVAFLTAHCARRLLLVFRAELNLDDVIEYSPLFIASRVFAVLASVWGGLAFVGLLLVVCSCYPNLKHRAFGLSALCVVAAICQGLSFLLLDSNMCTVVYANEYPSAGMVNATTSVEANVTATANVSVPVSPPSPESGSGGGADEWVEAVSCRPSIGMRMAIAAIVLYCVGALLALRAVPVTISSDPFHRLLPLESDDGAGKDEDDNEDNGPLQVDTTTDFASASGREIGGGGSIPEPLDEAGKPDGEAAR
jgi:hypothetical protein